MSFPVGMACMKCNREIGGMIIAPEAEKLIPLQLKFACSKCLNEMAENLNVKLDSPENWAKVKASLLKR